MANFELKVQLPKLAPVVFNYEELKGELTTALADYQNRVYTEDMIADAKTDAAKLNKLKKAISDERIARKKEWLEPFETFEAQAKEICQMIDAASSGIKTQLDTFEQKRITEKTEHIESMFAEIMSNYDLPFITFRQIFNEKWLNKTVTDKAITKEITEICEKAISDLEIIKRMPEYSFEAEQVYKQTLNLNNALSEGERMAKIAEAKKQAEFEAQKRAEEARLRAEEEAYRKAKDAEALMEKATEVNVAPAIAEPTPEPLYDLTFSCRITKGQAIELSEFCKANGIKLIKV